jgi:hypothetical protein
MRLPSAQLARLYSLVTACVIGAFLAGCDSAGTNGGSQNEAPRAEVTTSASTIDVGTQVTLDGSGSSDPDGDDLSFSWALATPSGSNAALSDPNAETPTFTPDVTGDYTATLQVSDGDTTASDDATVTAQPSAVRVNSDITTDSRWTQGNTYLVTSTVAITNSATLTIEPGTEILFEKDVALQVESGSALMANGTSSDPITMTATPGNAQQGWWKGVGILSNNPDNTLNYVEVRHAGSGDISRINRAANVAVNNGAVLTLTNSTITDGAAYGLYLNDSDSRLERFSNNSFSGHASAPIRIPFTSIGQIDAGSSFATGTYVQVDGATMTSDATIAALRGDTPYRFTGGPTIEGATVTVDPGVTMTFASGVGVAVETGAALVANGTSSDPITMTATPGNAQQGWWKGVGILSNNTDNTLNYVEVRHAGSGDISRINRAANVALNDGAALTLTRSTITDSGNHGVYCNDTDVSFTASNNSFRNNAGDDVNGCN